MLYRAPEFTEEQLDVLKGMVRYRWTMILQGRTGASADPTELLTEFIRVTDDFQELMEPLQVWGFMLVASGKKTVRAVIKPALFEAFREAVTLNYQTLKAVPDPSPEFLAFVDRTLRLQAEILAVLDAAPLIDPLAPQVSTQTPTPAIMN